MIKSRSVNMRYIKIISLLLAILLLGSFMVSCSDRNGGTEETVNEVFYTVRFSTVGGTPIDDVKVKEGGLVPEPEVPEKAGYVFGGWRTSEGRWFFDVDKVKSNLTLNAVWVAEKNVFEYEVVEEKVTITKYIGDIRELIIPKTLGGFPVVAIGEKAFFETPASSTERIAIGEHIKTLGNAAFYNCTCIEIEVISGLEQIGEQTFFGCTGLKSITLGSGMTEIPFEAFSGCASLKSVVLSDTVKTISENAFDQCTALQSMTAHSSLKKVEDSAFESCSAFVAVYYYGSDSEWESTEIAEGNNGNDVLLKARFYRYSETEPQNNDGKYWHFDDNGKVRIW